MKVDDIVNKLKSLFYNGIKLNYKNNNIVIFTDIIQLDGRYFDRNISHLIHIISHNISQIT